MQVTFHLYAWLFGRAAFFVYGFCCGIVPGMLLLGYIAKGIQAPKW